MIISDTASQIISTGSGFRNPSLYGSGEYELKGVLFVSDEYMEVK